MGRRGRLGKVVMMVLCKVLLAGLLIYLVKFGVLSFCNGKLQEAKLDLSVRLKIRRLRTRMKKVAGFLLKRFKRKQEGRERGR